MKYSEKFKKNQTKKVPSGFTMNLSCKYVIDVTNESEEKLKFIYDTLNETLTILDDNFNLLTIDYES